LKEFSSMCKQERLESAGEHGDFPFKKSGMLFLSHCGVSPLHGCAYRTLSDLARQQSLEGSALLERYDEIVDGCREAAAQLLQTNCENLSIVNNTASALNMVANAYPFCKGDQVVCYRYEYPSNYFPWMLQRQKGVELVPLEDSDPQAGQMRRPTCWSFEKLLDIVSSHPRVRVIAISHVQFTSGYAASLKELKELGKVCRTKGIDLVVDIAQSLGSFPFFPEELNVSVAASSGWKWMMGPIGTGVLYTSSDFRERLRDEAGIPVVSMGGVNAMSIGKPIDYLAHAWGNDMNVPHVVPREDARRFQFSTLPLCDVAALATSIREFVLDNRTPGEESKKRIGEIRDAILMLHKDILDGGRNLGEFTFTEFDESHRAGILSLTWRGTKARHQDLSQLAVFLQKENVVCTVRNGYLRFAPHFHNRSDNRMKEIPDLLIRAVRGLRN
jgi:cysteine desulfurase/selenocysteine lyase